MKSIKDEICRMFRRVTGIAAISLLAVSLFVRAVSAGPGEDSRKILVARGDYGYPPFEFLGPDGQPRGFNIDILNAIAREMNLSVKITLGPWQEVRRDLEEGRIDIITGMYYSEERDRRVDFSSPHFIVSYGIFVHRDSWIKGPDDLWNARIIVQDGDIGCDYVRSMGMGSIIITRRDWADVLSELSHGRADAAIVSRLQGIMFIEERGLKDIRPLDAPLFQRKYCIAVRQGDESLLNIINEGLSILRVKGEYARIHDRWFGVMGGDNGRMNPAIRLLLAAALFMSLVAAAAFLWSWTLRRQVRMKTEILSDELRDRRSIEETLRETEKKYTAVVEKSGQVVFDWDIPADRIMWAGAVLRVTGYTDRDFRDVSMKQFGDFIHPDERDEAMLEMEKAMRSLERYDREIRFRHRNGGYIFIAIQGFFLPNAGGEAVRMLGTMFDVTERRMAGEEIKRKSVELEVANARLQRTLEELSATNEELEAMNGELVETQKEIVDMNTRLAESERRLSTLVGNIPGIVYRFHITNNRNTIEYLSRGCLDVTGYDAAYLMRTGSGGLLELVVPEDRDVIMDHFARLRDGESTSDLRYRIIHRGGEIRWVWEKGVVISRVEDDIILEGLISDMTELERKDILLRQAQKLEVIGTLAGGIAHDFNNLLGGIDGSVALAERLLSRETLREGGKIGRYIGITRQASRRAAEMVKQLLTLSRRQEPVSRPLDVGRAIESVIGICGSTFPREIEIRVSGPGIPLMVKGDPVQMEQVILNLCVNASHAMTVMRNIGERQGGVLGVTWGVFTADAAYAHAHPGAEAGGEYARISVLDSGVGMDMQTRLRLFEPFFSTKSKELGTGLGLAIVYSIVTGWKGYIDVESEPGKGSVFTVILPLTREDASEDEGMVQTPLPGRGSGLVLVVDDEEIMRSVAGGILEEYGFTVMNAHNGEDGVALFRENHDRILVVVLDISMPVMSGEDACRDMKAIDPSVPILLSSGFRHDERVEQAMALGVDGFLQKPYTPEELIRSIFALTGDGAGGRDAASPKA